MATYDYQTKRYGRETVTGYVLGDYGMRKEGYFWDFTHLPTGLKLAMGPVATKPEAIATLTELAEQGPEDYVKEVIEHGAWGGEGFGLKAYDRNALPGGVAERRGFTRRDADPRELRVGIEHELEHTDDRSLAEEIALDHLAEDPRYYTHLVACEQQFAGREQRRNGCEYWVWALAKGRAEPLASEGPWGPYDLTTAKYYARIGAREGKHDRVVTHGREPRTLVPMRRYRAGTGEAI